MLNRFIGTTNTNGVTFTEADMKNSSKWGNYARSATTYTGRSANLSLGEYYWSISQWGEKQTDAKTATYTEYTTGASKKTEAYHTYDVAGNLWEWTEETGSNSNCTVLRGGSCHHNTNPFTACSRLASNTSTSVYYNNGFRVVLYMK